LDVTFFNFASTDFGKLLASKAYSFPKKFAASILDEIYAEISLLVFPSRGIYSKIATAFMTIKRFSGMFLKALSSVISLFFICSILLCGQR
jgi:hypothetical protein